MKLSILTELAQNGIRRFCADVFGDELAAEGIATEQWAWLWFQLREADDRPEWFPRGKWATLQVIEAILSREARSEVDGR